jgi:hypothetical protein
MAIHIEEGDMIMIEYVFTIISMYVDVQYMGVCVCACVCVCLRIHMRITCESYPLSLDITIVTNMI